MNYLSVFVLDDAQRKIIRPDAQYSSGIKTANGTKTENFNLSNISKTEL